MVQLWLVTKVMVEQSPVKLTAKFHDVHGVSASVLVDGSSW